jgi:hypothetical protein
MMPTDPLVESLLKCVGGALAFLVPAYLVLVYRMFPSRALVIVFVAVLVLLARSGVAMLVSEYALTSTPSGMFVATPNQTHVVLALLELAARLALIYSLVVIWQRPTQTRADASACPPE